MTTQAGNGGKINEEAYSRHLYELFTQGIGTRTLTAWKVIQRGAGANMSVDVQQGDGIIAISSQYVYPAWVASSDENVTVDASDPSNPRIDRVVAYIDLASISIAVTNNTGALKFMAVAGTPAGSPAAPNDAAVQTAIGASNPFIDLATIAVAAGATSVVTANITDKRPSMAVRAPQAPTVTEITTSTVLTYAYDVVKGNATGGAITATLPDATLQSGRKFTIYKSDTSANAVTIGRTSSQSIGGVAANWILPQTGSLLEVISDGSNWIVSRSIKDAFKFRVCKSDTTQAISGSTWTKVSFQTEQYDYNSNFDNATNYRYTAPVDGIYEFIASVIGEAAIGAVKLDQIQLYKNGATITTGLSIGHVTNTNNSATVSDQLALVAGDYIEVYFWSSAAGQLDGAANLSQTYFAGRLVGL